MDVNALLKLMDSKLSSLPTDTLKFVRDVGKSGLGVWSMSAEKRRDLKNVIGKLDQELARRKS